VGWQPPRMPLPGAGLAVASRRTNALSQEAGNVIGRSVFHAEDIARHSKKHWVLMGTSKACLEVPLYPC
jgi:hypothetical protein